VKKLLMAATLTALAFVAKATIAPVSGPSSVCVGSSISLSDVSSGGTWHCVNTIIGTISTAGVFSGIASGTDSVYYTTGTDTAWTVVTINPLPAPIAGSTMVCTGVPVTYTDATSGGAWSVGITYYTVSSISSAITSGGVLTALWHQDSLFVAYTLPTGCAARLPFSIGTSVGPITGQDTLCIGVSSVLVDTVGGGFWSISNPTVATVSPSGIVSGIAPGVDTVYYIVDTLVPVCAVAYPIVVNSGVDSPISGSSTLCLGHTNAYTNGMPGGTWSISNPSIATVDATGNVSGIVRGAVNITYSTSSSCYSILPLSVNNAATSIYYFGGATSICVGNTSTFDADSSGGIWSVSSTAIATVTPSPVSYPWGGVLNGAIVSNIAVGQDTLFFTSGPGCVLKLPFYVNPHPSPIIGPSAIYSVGATITLSDTSVGAGGYWVSSNPIVASISPAGEVTAFMGGSTHIQFVNSYGCSSSTIITVYDSCSGTPAPLNASIHIAYCSANDSLVTGSTKSGLSYQWQYATDITTWHNLINDTLPVVLFPIGSSAFYRCVSTCNASGLYSYSDTVFNAGSNTHIRNQIENTDSFCSGIQFNVSTCFSTSSLNVTAIFGDGTSQNRALSTTGGFYNTTFTHPYTFAGTYTIKEILYDGATALDSVTFDYDYHYCQTLPLKIFYDNNSNCLKDSNESYSLLPTLLKVDSNGVTVDTISALGGVYYKAHGNPGDIYHFTVVSTPGDMAVSCPSSGTVSFTISATGYYDTVKTIGLYCAFSTAAFDLAGNFTGICRRRFSTNRIYVRNSYCNPENATVTLTFSPKYNFTSSVPAPTSVAGNVVTWNLSGVASTEALPRHIWYELDHAGPFLTVGDTAKSTVVITPTSGDVDTTNNVIVNIDTIKISYDPNEMHVSPSGYILPGAQLLYTINFENTGNDTALNIYVMDTLPSGVDPGSLQMVSSSAACNVAIMSFGGHSIVKFDFPQINLLDSSHHGLCDGMVAFKINTLASLPNNATIRNHAGIFFDDNPVVMTDTSLNIISLISGANAVCLGGTITLTDSVRGGSWSSSNACATVAGGVVTGVTAGVDTIYYTAHYANGTVTTSKVVTVNNAWVAGPVSGHTGTCIGSTDTLSDIIPGGVWSVSNSHATITSGGVLTGVSVGVDTVVYTLTNACGVTVAKFLDTVVTGFTIGPVVGLDTVCNGGTITLIGSYPPAYSHVTWTSSVPTRASVVNGIVTATNVGADTIIYTVANACGVYSSSKIINIQGLPVPGTILVSDTLCVGSVFGISESFPGGTWSIANGAASLTVPTITGVHIGLDTIKYKIINACGRDSVSKTIYVNAALNAGAISGLDSLCYGNTIYLYDSVPGGVWSSVFPSVASVFALSLYPSASAVITGLGAGVDTIKYTIANSCGAVAAKFVVSVNPIPVAGYITGADSICLGTTATLHPFNSGGIWQSSDNTIVSVSDSGVISGLTAGSVLISYSITNMCGTDTVLKFVQAAILPPTSITGAATICIGVPDTMIVSPFGGHFTATNPHAAVNQNGVVFGYSNGTDTIQYLYHNVCGSDSSRWSLNVLHIDTPAAITGLANICVGGPRDTLYIATGGGVWSVSNGTASISGGIVTALAPGFDTISYAITNYCGTGYSNFLLKVFTNGGCDSLWRAGISNVSGNDDVLLIAPNPNSGTFTVVLPDFIGNVEFTLTDMYGKTISHFSNVSNETPLPLSFEDVARGNYILRAETAKKTYRAKVVIW
jgi:uncharacterized repeat protein (TIGR01451 family)